MDKNALLFPRLPAACVPYCAELWEQYQFELRIVRPRRTRLGDFTRRAGTAASRITLNADLNPYSFLITYLHEVAHHVAYTGKNARKIMPHGREWQEAFSVLLWPVLNENCFPADVLIPLRRYARRPKASTGSDAALALALTRYDQRALVLSDSNDFDKKILLQLREGENFVFQQKEFTRGPLRRTRVLCVEKHSKRRYTIPAHARVVMADTLKLPGDEQ